LKIAYLSLGSNLGDRAAHLAGAMQRLEAAGVRILRRSSVYETEPQDRRDQPWFLNMVIEVETDLPPLELLAEIQRIEKDMGRERGVSKGPRTIDVDILLYGDAVLETKELEIPHPCLAQRRFVLEPLAELAPEMLHPVIRKTVRELLPGTASQIVRRR
jgi:2-amino-4-hydroxy-6-hydroxymethyldihydropteridine diphosphokinase